MDLFNQKEFYLFRDFCHNLKEYHIIFNILSGHQATCSFKDYKDNLPVLLEWDRFINITEDTGNRINGGDSFDFQ